MPDRAVRCGVYILGLADAATPARLHTSGHDNGRRHIHVRVRSGAMQTMRGVVAAHVAVEHHAVRFRHQHAAALTLDHVFDHFCVSFWWPRAGLFTQALEQHPNHYGDDRQKNYFSHLSRPRVKSIERNSCYLSADNFCDCTLFYAPLLFDERAFDHKMAGRFHVPLAIAAF